MQSWPHLGNILCSYYLRDDDDIEKRRIHTVKQINDVLCYFGKLEPLIKLRLLYSYCSGLYGSELWDLSCDSLNSLYVFWRHGLKNVWKLPINTHSNILYGICAKRPIEIELKYRTLNFIYKCINSSNDVIRSISRQALSSPGGGSIVYKNFVHCCNLFGMSAFVPQHGFECNFQLSLQRASLWTRFVDILDERIVQVLELIMVRDGTLTMWPPDILTPSDIKDYIYCVCTS